MKSIRWILHSIEKKPEGTQQQISPAKLVYFAFYRFLSLVFFIKLLYNCHPLSHTLSIRLQTSARLTPFRQLIPFLWIIDWILTGSVPGMVRCTWLWNTIVWTEAFKRGKIRRNRNGDSGWTAEKKNQESVGSWSSSALAKQVRKILLNEDVTDDPRTKILNMVSGMGVTLSPDDK